MKRQFKIIDTKIKIEGRGVINRIMTIDRGYDPMAHPNPKPFDKMGFFIPDGNKGKLIDLK